MRLSSYADLKRRLEAFATGDYPLIIVFGRSGTSKTSLAELVLPEGTAHWIQGDVTEARFFEELRDNVDTPIVIDDRDDLHKDRGLIRLLKQLCQTKKPARITRLHMRNRPVHHEDGFEESDPGTVITSSPLLVITNDWARLNRHVAAIEDRGLVIEFAPSADEIHAYVGPWFLGRGDAGAQTRAQEVYDFIGGSLEMAGEYLTIRDYELGVKDHKNGFDWKQVLSDRWAIVKCYSDAAEIRADPSYATEAERIEAFTDRTGLCKQTYYNHLDRSGISRLRGGKRSGAGRRPKARN